jgi:hypothetical protein
MAKPPACIVTDLLIENSIYKALLRRIRLASSGHGQ